MSELCKKRCIRLHNTTVLSMLLLLVTNAHGQDLHLTYPCELNQRGELIVPAVDSIFALGQVRGNLAELELNGQQVTLQTGGRWLHWLERSDSLNFTLETDSGSVQQLYTLGYADQLLSTELAEAEFIRINRPGCSLKTAVRGTYFAFPQPGTVFTVLDTEHQMYHVAFGNEREGWIRPHFATPVKQQPPAPDVIHRLSLETAEEGASLLLAVRQQPVLEQLSHDRRQLQLTFTNAVSNIDVIKYPQTLTETLQVNWQQQEQREVQLTINLTQEQLLGYRLIWGAEGCQVDLRFESRFSGSRWSFLNPGKGWTIMLDPGHGGVEKGAVGPAGLMEKQVNLELANLVRARLEKKGFTVLMTREDDRQVGLAERVALAQKSNATLFVSLHFNSTAQGNDPRKLGGTSLYWYYPQSVELARSLHSQLVQQMQLGDDGFYYRNLAVLRNSWMPAVLVEGGYIIQPETEAMLEQGGLLKREAKAICNAIVKYRKSL